MRRRCKDETFQSLTTAKAPPKGVSRRMLVVISRRQHGNDERESTREEEKHEKERNKNKGGEFTKLSDSSTCFTNARPQQSVASIIIG